MMLSPQDVDLSRPLQADVCIVGAGAAGITLACELDASGLDVLLLDAGAPAARRDCSQDPYEGTAEHPHAPPRFFRRLGFGGTTAIWGGRCVPLDPIDFAVRSHVPGSGWPVSFEEVARHYPRAMAYCDAGAFEFLAQQALSEGRPFIPGLTSGGGLRCDAIERYSLPTHFGRRYRDRLARSANVRVLGPAHAVRLRRDPHADRLAALECRTGPGSPAFSVQAQRFVLATGGIEVPRLLLASGGLGNRHDLVGRFYSCHVENFIGRVRPRRPGTQFQFTRTRDGVYARGKLLIDEETQHRQRLLNTSFRLHYPNVADASHASPVLSAVYLARRTLIPEYRRILQHGVGEGVRTSSWVPHALNVARGLPQLAAFGLDWTRRRILAQRKLPYVLAPNADGSYVLEFNAEQTPLRDSRIVLNAQEDAFGVPRVHVDWKLCDDDIDSLCRTYALLRTRLDAAGVDLEFDERSLRRTLADSVPLGGHHIGTARMGHGPKDGVVDRQGALFELPNLYVCSSAMFTTSGHANPTLTIVAMAIRMAAHLQATSIRVAA